MARKRKPITQEEQSRRFEEAAREAGVSVDNDTLAEIVRQIGKAVAKKQKPIKSPGKK